MNVIEDIRDAVKPSHDHPVAKKVAIAAGAAGSAFASWALLPALLTKLANFALTKIPGYRGRVGRVELHPLGGSVSISGLYLAQQVDGHYEPLLEIDKATAVVHWKHLLTGALLADAIVEGPRAYIDLQTFQKADAPQPPAQPARAAAPKQEPTWQQKIRDLSPFQLNLEIRQGEVHVQGLPGQGLTDVALYDFQLSAFNISNSKRLSAGLLAQLECSARVMSSGRLSLYGQGYPLADSPAFNADLKLEGVDLTELAPFAREFAGVDVKRGKLATFIEAAAKDGKLGGYAKPVIDRLEVERVKDQGAGTFAKAVAVEAAIKLLESRKEDRIATKVEFDGRLDDPDLDILGTVGVTLKNAFIAALGGHFENRVWLQRAGSDETQAEIHFDQPKRSKFRRGFELVKDAGSRWAGDHATKMSAALAYYTAFSMAPLLLLIMAIAGLAFGKEAAQGQIMNQLTGLMGKQSAGMIQSMIQAAHKPAQGAIATVIGVVTLIAGASGVLSELKDSLNKIWQTEAPSGISALVKQNLKFLGIIAAIGFLLLVSLALSAGLAAVGKAAGGALPIPEWAMHIIEFFISWGIISSLFGLMYKVLPNVVIPWKDVWIGGLVTGLLFSLGKLGLGAYLGKGTVGSSYGAAGSILVVLLWVYYSGLIFFFGAEFTHVYSEHYGSRKHKPDEQPELKKAA
jgi:membrane protein